MPVTYADYLAYRRGQADDELSTRIEEALADPESPLRLFIAGIGDRSATDPLEAGLQDLLIIDSDLYQPPRDESVRPEMSSHVPPTIPFRALTPTKRRSWKALLAVAASLALIAGGTLVASYLLRSRANPIHEGQVAAWLAGRLDGKEGTLKITAGPGDDEERSLINELDETVQDPASLTPAIRAPINVQRQLVVPELDQPGAAVRPLRTVVQKVAAGGLYYLRFSVPSGLTRPTAVVIRQTPGAWTLLWDEVAVSPSAESSYFGPLEAGTDPVDYLIIVADQGNRTLLETVSDALTSGGRNPASITVWKQSLARQLHQQGHQWFGVQRVRVEPQSTTNP